MSIGHHMRRRAAAREAAADAFMKKVVPALRDMFDAAEAAEAAKSDEAPSPRKGRRKDA